MPDDSIPDSDDETIPSPDGFDLSVDGARAAARQDRLGDWVAAFLASDGSDNVDLAKMLRDDVRSWAGPMQLPFDELNRLAGPPDQPTLGPLGEDDIETVEEMEDSIDEGWEPPPFVVTYRDGQLVLEDGNHRIEGLRRQGHDRYWSVVGCFDCDDTDELTDRYALD